MGSQIFGKFFLGMASEENKEVTEAELFMLRRRGYSVMAVDLSAALLQQCKLRLEGEGLDRHPNASCGSICSSKRAPT